MRIKGIYATEVGDDTPILTRLMQWKIVPKRAVYLGIEFKDASASSRSSVNNCTASPPVDTPLDFSSPPTRADKRRILRRLHESSPVRQRKQSPPTQVRSNWINAGNLKRYSTMSRVCTYPNVRSLG